MAWYVHNDGRIEQSEIETPSKIRFASGVVVNDSALNGTRMFAIRESAEACARGEVWDINLGQYVKRKDKQPK